MLKTLIRLLLLKCYDIKMVKSPGGPFYRFSSMRLTNKKKAGMGHGGRPKEHFHQGGIFCLDFQDGSMARPGGTQPWWLGGRALV